MLPQVGKERCHDDTWRIFEAQEKKGKGRRAWADLELAGLEPQ